MQHVRSSILGCLACIKHLDESIGRHITGHQLAII
jgi:hypothetical protein